MTNGIKIEDLFLKDVKRNINGVIKVDQDDEASIYTELDEYVVTKESREHFDKFFTRYLNTTQEPIDKIGVWVSGFFGSGKSHFIKILSYLMENRTVHDKTALEFFREKIEDTLIFDNIERSVNYGTKDVILFNIDSKASTVDRDNELIVNVMMRAFNEKRGYYRDVFWIAEMEEDLDNKGLYDSFKEEFLKLNGDSWENKRSSYAFEQDDIVGALVNCGYQSREANERLFDNDGIAYHFDVEKFAEKLKKYCDSKGNDHQIIFLIDEIGQYIGENSELMLNLQTIVEELGTKLLGKAWVIVTSQADIDLITQEKVKGYDFSKIQGRFDTRLSLSSANVDEVIKRRILAKKEDCKDMLSVYFDEKQTILKNLLSFSNGTAQMKLYSGSDDFTNVYPFVPYQFIILQKVFDQIRQTGYTGKHLAKGERSMLNAFKEASVKYCDDGIGILVPFSSFYSTVESFLDPIIKRTIKQAEDNDVLNKEDCDLLKILFMIRHVADVQPNLENLVALSVSSVDEDKLELKKRVAESLKKLEGQTLINKSGDSYSFLTNEEQDINRKIKNLDIDRHLILDDIYNTVFTTNDICPVKHSKYVFNRVLDDKIKPSNNADITVKFLTPLSDELTRGSGQRSLHGENLSNIDSTDTLLFIFPDKSDFVDMVRKYLRISKYLTQNSSRSNNDILHRIMLDKTQEMERLKESAVKSIFEGASEARIFIHGKEVTSIGNKNPKDRVKEGLDMSRMVLIPIVMCCVF
ncbi:BREX system P-loop protein BrxC [Methanococcoides seepicolus]|uniref:BREX system P-loop protein BrxC n=1 Tax=Methanococcoides seepicolus TaxID=2828780 RepID=UPI002032EF55|nr:BREX system P-loop protein BrxC [Methanococcoides seepicolus]